MTTTNTDPSDRHRYAATPLHRLTSARQRADEALAGSSFGTAQQSAPRHWWCFGDPQAGFDKFCAVLDHHGLLNDEGLLQADVGLVSMGDHFDFGAGTYDDVAGHAERGIDGQRILAFLAAHPRSQVRILLGNHDAARVIEFAHLDDERFRSIRAASYAVGKTPDEERTFAVAHGIPWASMPKKDFCTWSEAQRSQVERLLLAGRYDLAAVGIDEGCEILLTHTGVTRRELGLLNVDGTATPREIAARLNELLTKAVAGVAQSWTNERHTPLSLAPLHVAPGPGEEAGGFLAHRPANPATWDPWAWNETRPRRFAPSTLPRTFDQAVGHTGATMLARGLKPWSDGNIGLPGRAHTLFVEGESCRLVVGIAANSGGSTRLLLLDPGLAHAEATAVDLLRLDSVE